MRSGKKIDFAKEIAVIVSRNISGEIAAYPVVEMSFHPEGHMLDYLFAPSSISPTLAKKAEGIAKTIAEKLGVVGLLAVEMFITRDGDILVNEIAPRPHNSGHHTIEANRTSQFEQLIRAALNLSPGDTSMISSSVMFNILGSNGYSGPAQYHGIEDALKIPGVYVHLYGKRLTSPLRKMGHVTVINNNLKKAKETAQWLKEKIKVTA